MPYQTRIPEALARFGLKVETVPGWQTRGSSTFTPRGAVSHWTAGPRGSTTRPSLNICTNGRTGLPGPLCNVYLDRKGIAVVVAAGRANHAGVGGWKGLTANSQVFGTEAECGGDGDWTAAQRAAYPRVNAAYCWLGGFGPEMCCGHHEWATPPGRKVDIRDWPMSAMRSQVAAILASPQEDNMPLTDADLNRIRDRILHSPIAHDGKIVNGQPWLSSRVAGADGVVNAVLAEVRAMRGTIDALVKLVAEQNGLTLDDVRRVVAEEIDRGIDVDVTVQGGDQPATP